MEQICSNCDLSNPVYSSVCKNCRTPLGKHSKGSFISNRYRIISFLGKGNMGHVFKAMDTQLDRVVAIKSIFLKDIISRDQRERTKKRISREARSQARLADHSNIVIVYDFLIEDDHYHIIMEYITGHDLEHYIKKEIMLPLNRVLEIICDICAALDYAHKNKIIHRDIKPSNIIITQNNITKIADFGIAKLQGHEETNITKTGMLVGTPYYMSPEQILGKQLDGRSDIWSIGCILYKLLARKNPFEGQSIIQILDAIVVKPHKDIRQYCPDAPEEIIHIIDKALKKDIAERYADTIEMQNDIKAYLSIGPLHSKTKTGDAEIIGPGPDTEADAEAVLTDPQKTILAEISKDKKKPGFFRYFIYGIIILSVIISAIFLFIPFSPDPDDFKAVSEINEIFEKYETEGADAEKPSLLIAEHTPQQEQEHKTIPEQAPESIEQVSQKEESVVAVVTEDTKILDELCAKIENLILNKDHKKAREETKRGLVLYPANPRLLQLKGRINDIISEEVLPGPVITPDPPQIEKPEAVRPAINMPYLLNLFEKNNFREIIDLYENNEVLFDLDHDQAEALYLTGISYSHTLNYDKAVEVLIKASNLFKTDSDLARSAIALSDTYKKMSDPKSAISVLFHTQSSFQNNDLKKQLLSKALTLFLDQDNIFKAGNLLLLNDLYNASFDIGIYESALWASYEMAELYFASNDLKNSILSYNNTLKHLEKIPLTEDIKKAGAFAHYRSGLCHSTLNNTEEAYSHFSEALKYFENFMPDSEEYIYILTWLIQMDPGMDIAARRQYLVRIMRHYAQPQSRDHELYAGYAVELSRISYKTEPQRIHNMLTGIQLSRIRDNSLKGKVNYYIGLSLAVLSNHSEALRYLRSSNRFFTQSRDYDHLGLVALEKAKICSVQNDLSSALVHINTAKDHFRTGSNNYLMALALEHESRIHIEQRNRTLARDTINMGINILQSELKTSAELSESERSDINELIETFQTLRRTYLF